MRAYVDPDTCIGCGLCPSLCSDVFRMTDSGVAEAYNDADGFRDATQEAIDSCPVSAIHWAEEP